MATIVDTVPVPLAMIFAVFTNVRGIACFEIFTPRNPALGARKSAAKELKIAWVHIAFIREISKARSGMDHTVLRANNTAFTS